MKNNEKSFFCGLKKGLIPPRKSLAIIGCLACCLMLSACANTRTAGVDWDRLNYAEIACGNAAGCK